MVYIFDYTSRSLPYDSHLIESILENNCDLRFICESKTSNAIVNEVVNHGIFPGKYFSGKTGPITKIVKSVKYLITLFYYSFLFKRGDVVHFQWLPFLELTKIEYYYIKILKRRGIKTVLTVHNVLPHDSGNKYFNAYKNIYELIDHIICHTENSMSELNKRFSVPKDKITKIPHGPLKIYDECRDNDDFKDGLKNPTAILFGRIKKYKGYDILLQAVRNNKSLFSEMGVKIKILGKADKEVETYINEYLVTHNIDQLVETKFYYLSNEELHDEICNSTVILLPYKDITQSGVLYLSVSYKKPIITSDLPGFREEFGDALLYFKHLDPDDLAHNILDILKDGKKYTLYKERVSETSKNLSWKSIGSKTVNLYKKI